MNADVKPIQSSRRALGVRYRARAGKTNGSRHFYRGRTLPDPGLGFRWKLNPKCEKLDEVLFIPGGLLPSMLMGPERFRSVRVDLNNSIAPSPVQADFYANERLTTRKRLTGNNAHNVIFRYHTHHRLWTTFKRERGGENNTTVRVDGHAIFFFFSTRRLVFNSPF